MFCKAVEGFVLVRPRMFWSYRHVTSASLHAISPHAAISLASSILLLDEAVQELQGPMRGAAARSRNRSFRPEMSDDCGGAADAV